MHRIILGGVGGHARAAGAINWAGRISSGRMLVLGERRWIHWMVVVIHHVVERGGVPRELHAPKTCSILLSLIRGRPSGLRDVE